MGSCLPVGRGDLGVRTSQPEFALIDWCRTRLPTGRGKLEKVSEFEWSGKVLERSGENIFCKSQGK